MELQLISNRIYELRGFSVILDFTLAELYEVETRALKQAVKRNKDRFPEDFMFVLNDMELEALVSQNVIPSKSKFGGAKPFAFTEQGVAMLSSVLRSKKAIQVNISIMRAFVLMRRYALSHKELTDHLRKLEDKYDKQFGDIYEVINYLLQKENDEKEQENRNRIGFRTKKFEGKT